MNVRDETHSYGDLWKEATYEDDTGSNIPFKDKNGVTIRYLDVLVDEKHALYFQVRKDEDYNAVLYHIPTRTIEKLTQELAGGMERL